MLVGGGRRPPYIDGPNLTPRPSGTHATVVHENPTSPPMPKKSPPFRDVMQERPGALRGPTAPG